MVLTQIRVILEVPEHKGEYGQWHLSRSLVHMDAAGLEVRCRGYLARFWHRGEKPQEFQGLFWRYRICNPVVDCMMPTAGRRVEGRLASTLRLDAVYWNEALE